MPTCGTAGSGRPAGARSGSTSRKYQSFTGSSLCSWASSTARSTAAVPFGAQRHEGRRGGRRSTSPWRRCRWTRRRRARTARCSRSPASRRSRSRPGSAGRRWRRARAGTPESGGSRSYVPFGARSRSYSSSRGAAGAARASTGTGCWPARVPMVVRGRGRAARRSRRERQHDRRQGLLHRVVAPPGRSVRPIEPAKSRSPAKRRPPSSARSRQNVIEPAYGPERPTASSRPARVRAGAVASSLTSSGSANRHAHELLRRSAATEPRPGSAACRGRPGGSRPARPGAADRHDRPDVVDVAVGEQDRDRLEPVLGEHPASGWAPSCPGR